MQFINTEVVPTPRSLVRLAKPTFKFNLDWWKARAGVAFGRLPSGEVGLVANPTQVDYRARVTPSLKQTTVLARWQSFSPGGLKDSPSCPQSATFDVADVAAEEEGRLIRLGRYAFFSDKRARQATALAGAASRFIAMHRTSRKKIGMFRHSTEVFVKRAEKALAKVQQTEKEMKLLAQFLRQTYKGKRKITIAQKEEAAGLLKVQVARYKAAKKRYDKWTKLSSF